MPILLYFVYSCFHIKAGLHGCDGDHIVNMTIFMTLYRERVSHYLKIIVSATGDTFLFKSSHLRVAAPYMSKWDKICWKMIQVMNR